MQQPHSSGPDVEQMLRHSQKFVDRCVRAGSTQLGNRMVSTAENLHRAGKQIRHDDELFVPMADLADRSADMMTRLGEYLREADSQRLITDFDALARSNPMMTAGTAFVLGLVAARFLRAPGASCATPDAEASTSPGASRPDGE